jgi:hypothetical protein
MQFGSIPTGEQGESLISVVVYNKAAKHHSIYL